MDNRGHAGGLIDFSGIDTCALLGRSRHTCGDAVGWREYRFLMRHARKHLGSTVESTSISLDGAVMKCLWTYAAGGVAFHVVERKLRRGSDPESVHGLDLQWARDGVK